MIQFEGAPFKSAIDATDISVEQYSKIIINSQLQSVYLLLKEADRRVWIVMTNHM